MTESLLKVRVDGEFACFTRPESKVERVSYPVMTPSAARGVLEAIFWKPEFRWRVREIAVLKEIQFTSLRRNEISSRQSPRAAMSGSSYFADEDRSQRHTLALRDVAYVIGADVQLQPHANEPEAKYRDMFRRRVSRGQCFQQPYLGCREFVAMFRESDEAERPVDVTVDLGLMLWDQDFTPDAKGPIEFRVHGAGGPRWERGSARPGFFRARLDHGVLRVPKEPLKEVA